MQPNVQIVLLLMYSQPWLKHKLMPELELKLTCGLETGNEEPWQMPSTILVLSQGKMKLIIKPGILLLIWPMHTLPGHKPLSEFLKLPRQPSRLLRMPLKQIMMLSMHGRLKPTPRPKKLPPTWLLPKTTLQILLRKLPPLLVKKLMPVTLLP